MKHETDLARDAKHGVRSELDLAVVLRVLGGLRHQDQLAVHLELLPGMGKKTQTPRERRDQLAVVIELMS